MTSKKTSFFRYRIPSDRHDTAFVTVGGGRTCISSLCDSWVMYLSLAISICPMTRSATYSCKILLSVVWGKPKSIISSRSSYIITKLSRMDSSSSSLKYSINTWVKRWRYRMISAALLFRFDSARTMHIISSRNRK